MLNGYEKEIWRIDVKDMAEEDVCWKFQSTWETHDSTHSVKQQSKIPHEDAICLVVDTIDIWEVLNLANETEGKMGDLTFTFFSKPTESGTDICATHHIYYLEKIFIGAIRKIGNVDNIRVKRMVSGIGTVQFTIKHSDGTIEISYIRNHDLSTRRIQESN